MEVEDYVRVKNTEKNYIEITKIKKFYLDEFEDYRDNDYWVNEIIKSSPNIIDLIEYGDIVKYKIDDEEFISEVWGEKNDYFVQNFDVPIDLKDLNIVSIVTKEQFESMEYKVGK